jgi:hypothetical protein
VGTVFFDARFERAHQLAVDLANGSELRPTNGDPTDVVLWFEAQRRSIGRISGLTVESIPFALQQLNPTVGMSIERLDRDLFLWMI